MLLLVLLVVDIQRVVVNVVHSEDFRVFSIVTKGSMLGSLLLLLYTSYLSKILENAPVVYADDSALFAKVLKPGNRWIAVSSLNRDLTRTLVFFK